MTDKQIIFDDVDVKDCIAYAKSQTVYLGNTVYKQMEKICMVKNQPCKFFDCQFKQMARELKRKEQECEAYKMEAEEGKEINAELKAENENLKQYKASKQASYESMQREWNRAVNANRELKADNKHLNDLLNQALKELEEMRELKDTESLQAYILTRENERLKELLAQDQCFQDRSHKCVKSFYIDERYKQAIEKVREIANRPYLLPCGGNCKQQNCTDKTTENGKHCMELKLIQILQICDEVNDETTNNEKNNRGKVKR